MFDFHNPNEPLSFYREYLLGKGKRCQHCRKTIQRNQLACEIKFFNGPQDASFHFHPDCFRASGFETNYQHKFLKNSYTVEDFRNFDYMLYSAYENILQNFDFDRALALIVNPPLKKHRLFYEEPLIQAAQIDQLNFGERGETNHSASKYLFTILVKCGYRERLLDLMDTLPPHCWVLFAMHDDRGFQEKAAQLFKAPQLPAMLERLRKSRLSLDDMLAVSQFGQTHPHFLTALADAIDTYELDYGYTLDERGFSEFSHVRNGQLCYFFISQPHRLPLLDHYMRTNKFPYDLHGELTYIQCFYHRAVIFHCLLNRQTEALNIWLDTMTAQIHYHPAGSPKGFISDTLKMVEKYRVHI